MIISKNIEFDQLLDLIPKINEEYGLRLRIKMECNIPDIGEMYYKCTLCNAQTVIYSELSFDYNELQQSKQRIIDKVRMIVSSKQER